jgi:nitroreductase
VALGMLAHFDRALAAGPWQYAELLRECGRIGQLLYLEAEAAGLSGTGIGCFFDPQVHELLGIADSRLQSLYHFTLGRALVDPRISTQPAYAELRRPPRTEQQGVIHE